MAAGNYYQDVKHVIHLTTDVIAGSCKLCKETLEGKIFDECINHYIEKHGYKILHIGTETSHDASGNVWHDSAAILGK